MANSVNVEGVLNILNKCKECLFDFQNNSLIGMNSAAVDNLIEEVNSVLNIIGQLSKGATATKNYVPELCNNMLYSLQKLKELLLQEKKDEAKLLLKCECISILKMLLREIDFFYKSAVDEESLSKYFEEEERKLREVFYTEKKDPYGEFPYDISIVVLFYNNKDITKLCIDSIYEYTKDINFELITVNNGSDEETTAWANALPHSKKINLKYNIGSSRGGALSILPNIFDGRFTVYLSNDVVVTKNWLTSLIECIKSDPRIAFASPVYNSSSNRQTVPVSYTNIEEMQQFAEKYNQPNPLIWEDRARLFGIAMILRPWVFEKVGGMTDLYFSYDMFADDDLCVKINRAGYRMVLCKDTFLHHFGSATLKDGQFEVMEKGRSQFYQKYGFDSWGALGDKFIYFESMMNFNKNESVKILAVNPQYGEEFLMLKNALKRSNIQNVTVDVFNMEERFQWGLMAVADRVFYGSCMSELDKYLDCNKYNIILLCQEAASCMELETLLRASANHLYKNGKLFILLDNIYSRNVIYNILAKGNLSDDYGQKDMGRKAFISVNALISFADTLGLQNTDIIRVNSYYQRNEVIEQAIAKIIQLDNTENDICYNTMYYNLGFGLK